MDIRCERCGSEYEFDENRLTDAGVTVKCTTCGHVFKVRRPTLPPPSAWPAAPPAAWPAPPVPAPAPAPAPPPAAPAPSPWSAVGAAAWPVSAPPPAAPPSPSAPPLPARTLLVSVGGQPPIACPDVGTLQRWVAERRVQREDQACWVGEPWRRAGEWPELAPFFAIVSPPPVVPSAPPPIKSAPPPPVHGADDISSAPTQQLRVPDFVAAGLMDAATAATTPGLAAVRPPPAHTPSHIPSSSAASPADADTAPSLRIRPPARPEITGWSAPSAGYGSFPGTPAPAVPAVQPGDTATFRAPSIPGQVAAASAPAETSPYRIPSLPALSPAAPAPAAETIAFARPATAPGMTPVSPAAPVPAETAAFRTTGTSSPVLPPGTPAPTPPMPIAAFGAPLQAAVTEPPAPPAAPAPPVAVPAPAPASAPAAEAAVDTQPPAPRMPEKTPALAEDEEDPEVANWKKAQKAKRAMIVVVFAVVLAGVGIWAVLGPMHDTVFGPPKIPPEARAAFETARQAWYRGTKTHMDEAVGLLGTALESSAKARAGYAEAVDLLATVQCARTDFLFDEARALEADSKAETAAGRAKEAQEAAQAAAVAQTAATEAREAAVKVIADAGRQFRGHHVGALAHVDCLRVGGEANRVKDALAKLPPDSLQGGDGLFETDKDDPAARPDPEAKTRAASVAKARAAMATAASKAKSADPAALSGAEKDLADAVAALPDFVPAKWWLARVKDQRGDKPGALAMMKDLAGHGHERAKAYVDAASRQPPAPPVPEEAKIDDKTRPPEAGKPEVKPAEVKPAAPAEAHRPEAAPVNPDALMKQADDAMEKGKAARALPLYEQVIAVKPDRAEAWYGKGLAQFDLGRMADAQGSFKKALDTNPQFADAAIGMAEACKELKQVKDAVRWYRKYLEILPDGDQAEVAKANIKALGN